MAPQKPTESQYKNVNNVKELFDLIGKYIQQKVHSEALDHSKSELHGFLSKVEFTNHERTNVLNACDINDKFETNVTSGHSNPCEGRSKDRFSDTQGAECDRKKIKDSESDSVGACAPHRRLSLCDQNLEQIQTDQIKSTHNLYIDVLLAAKHEGQMIATKLKEYDATNYDSRICTELARSFADIGDIIRGRDLYLGNKKKNQQAREKEKLEIKLKSFFKNIYDDLIKDQRKKVAAIKHYFDPKGNYYQLREDWWDLNRHDVWKAITCDAPDNAKYFRNACSNDTTETDKKCRCVNRGDVPTYFDYVPQYLRWFEEWSEDFCRIKRRKLQNLEKECRGVNESGNKRYCSRNGYDCEKTVRARGELCMGNRCINCFYACPRYEKWIDNQKQEFLKQKKKYAKEISNSGRQKRSTNNYKGYDRKFYDELQNEYGGVNKFLDLLNKEKTCKDITDEKEGKIDFKEDHDNYNNSDKEKGTFYRSDYCEPCPLCGVKCQGGTCTPHPEDQECPSIYKIYNPDPSDPSTDITILSSGEGHDDINKKLDAFCKNSNDNSSLYEEWKCYYKDAQNEACIKEKPLDGKVKKQKSYNNFFYYWVAHMLKDSIHWRTEKIKKCLENGTKTRCKNNEKCKTDCDCFKRWVKQKETEWDKIKQHFNTQEGFDKGEHEGYGFTHDVVLEGVLKEEFLKGDSEDGSTQDTQNSLDAEELKHLKEINKMLDEEEAAAAIAGVVTGKKKTIMDKLIDYEEGIATKCKDCQETQQESAARSQTAADPTAVPVESDSEEEDEGDEDGDEVGGEEEQPVEEEPKKDEICENGIVNCNKHEAYSTSTCKPKVKLIGLEAHFYKGGVDYPNVYISPRVQQLCLQPLQDLKNNTQKDVLINALKICAYNEAKGLYEYYKKNKAILGINDSQLSEKEIEKYILKAMERSYADYGSIVKGDILCDYKDKKNIDPKIINFVKHHNTSTTKTSVSKSDDEDSKRQKLWESIRTNIWKAMLCGYKDAGGSFDNHDVQCKLPDTEKTNQLFRWFIEWGKNFCIRREQELKQLKEICEKGICNGTDETKKKECKMLCESYKQFLSNSKTQYENQKKEYEDLKYTIPEFMKKDALTFLNEKCNSKCLCFETKDKTDVHKLFKYPSDDVKDECECKKAKAPEAQVHDLDKCPNEHKNNNICNKYNTNRICGKKKIQILLNTGMEEIC
ncbi:hypothetical protein C923_04149 [Plasmodium falciparum UGT5.1]|uniref:Duffy-binding-like domain-containing protein n=1 Tax=Plasmodium falciparum UGT5.1 TaxID=1237627 RepID=W7JJU3_PLAFA|nr:hypothetical protein C923_04149 [Plasmodium falciparum UGT5.1]